MLRNYLTVACRSLARHKAYAAINSLGLTIGMACCLLIALYVRHELSYDRFHSKVDRTYRLVSPSEPMQFLPLGPLLKEELPEVEEVTRTSPTGFTRPLISYGDKQFYHMVYHADESFFRVFDFPFVRGDRASALSRPYTVVISTEIAEQYFGRDDPLGKRLRWDTSHELEVAGVIELPTNTHFPFHLLYSLETFAVEPVFSRWDMGSWSKWAKHFTYLVLTPGCDPAGFRDRVLEVIERHGGAELRQQLEREGDLPYLQRLADLHLHSHFKEELQPGGNASTVYLLSAIAAFVLLIACVNFTSLSTAMSTSRAREVGIRKAMGGQRGQLAWQFLAEAVLLAEVALLPAVLLVQAVLPWFSAFLGVDLSLGWGAAVVTVPALAGVALATGLVAGAYPALVLSGLRPALTVKGRVGRERGGATLRRGLVTVQFGLSVLLVVGAAAVHSQLEFLRSRDLGFDRKQVIGFHTGYPGVSDRVGAVKEAFGGLAGVESVARFQQMPFERYWDWLDFRIRLADDEEEGIAGVAMAVDEGFLDLLDMELVAGIGFQDQSASGSVLLNETAARQLGFEQPRDVVGRLVGVPWWGGGGVSTVRGVVVDFHFETLRRPIGPAMLGLATEASGGIHKFMGVELSPGDLRSTLERLESTWAQLVPGYPMGYWFLDERFGKQYRDDERLGVLLRTFSGLAVFVACLGVLSLAASSAEKRTREIGIRKALGATAVQVLLLLVGELAWVVTLANGAAWPLAYWGAGRWLDTFAYRTELGPMLFLAAGAGVMGAALCTAGLLALRKALADPAEALRYE